MTRKIGFLVFASLLCCNVFAQSEKIQLPAPNGTKTVKMSLMTALQNRHSVREYSENKDISNQDLSNLLWAACGYNRPKEKRITAPSALNLQDIIVYVCRKDGAYRYNPGLNCLESVTTKDLRYAVAGPQNFVKSAPVCLVLVSDQTKFKTPDKTIGALDAGYVSQNICLGATAIGLATVPRATMNKEELAKGLGLKENQILMINHPVGWPKR